MRKRSIEYRTEKLTREIRRNKNSKTRVFFSSFQTVACEFGQVLPRKRRAPLYNTLRKLEILAVDPPRVRRCRFEPARSIQRDSDRVSSRAEIAHVRTHALTQCIRTCTIFRADQYLGLVPKSPREGEEGPCRMRGPAARCLKSVSNARAGGCILSAL